MCVHITFIAAAACSNRKAKKKSFHIQSLAFSISNERMLLCEIQEVSRSQQKRQKFVKQITPPHFQQIPLTARHMLGKVFLSSLFL